MKRMHFFSVHNASTKIATLYTMIDRHVDAHESIGILLPDEKTLHWLSELLWSHPQDSFRPHTTPFFSCSHTLVHLFFTPCKDVYHALFNLSPNAIHESNVNIFYEFEDTSSPYKTALFQKKFSLYQKAGIPITSS